MERRIDFTIVSFDKDFNKTKLGRKTPEDICLEIETDKDVGESAEIESEDV